MTEGTPPPRASRLEVIEGDEPEVARGEDGIAIGGLRPPPVAVPVEVLSSEPGPGAEMICVMTGSSVPLSPERLAELYESPADYEGRYLAAVDEAIEHGFILEDDREAIEAYLEPEAIPAG